MLIKDLRKDMNKDLDFLAKLFPEDAKKLRKLKMKSTAQIQVIAMTKKWDRLEKEMKKLKELKIK